jgi:DnaJ family protein A protein 2
MFFDPEDLFGGGMGGFPGGGFGGRRPQRPRGDNTALYRELGVETKATATEIKKAYRKLAREHHPDRGGDQEKFKAISNAYEVLSDPNRRKAYDATGDPNADPREVMNQRPKRKGKATQFELSVPLDQFFTGKTRRIRVTKRVICEGCEGKGGHGVATCSPCGGRGIRIVDRRIGMNMIQRMQMECDRCSGKGKVTPEGQTCKTCIGVGLKKETKVLAVEIMRGMKHDEKITFSEEGDQHPDMTAGDVHVILKQAPHPLFKRSPEGCHLTLTKKITLLEALTGFQFALEHLDGRTLIVSSEPNTTYKQGDIKAIKEEGFPLRNSPGTNGHMYITLDVVMPTTLDAKTANALKQLLGPVVVRPELTAALQKKARMNANTHMDTGEEDDLKLRTQDCTLQTVNIEAEKRAYRQLLQDEHNAYDSDEEQEGHGQQVGCRTQ